MDVIIDGVRYVPVSDAHIAMPAIEDAIVSQWAGDSWRSDYPDAPGYLRVMVGEGLEPESSETVHEFAARLLAAAREGEGDRT